MFSPIAGIFNAFEKNVPTSFVPPQSALNYMGVKTAPLFFLRIFFFLTTTCFLE